MSMRLHLFIKMHNYAKIIAKVEVLFPSYLVRIKSVPGMDFRKAIFV